jgi:phosphoglycerate dehydrogenase-like enzyme
MTKIAVLDDYQNVAQMLGPWDRLGNDVQLTAFTEHLAGDEVGERLAPFEVVVAMRERTPFTRELLEALPNLRLLVTTGPANAAIDVDAAAELGIAVAATGFSLASTVELTWGLILATTRHLCAEDRAVREGRWQHTIGPELHGGTLGLVGLGNTGRMMAPIARAFGMRVTAWSLNLTEERAAAEGIEAVSRERLFAESDVVSVHYSLGERSRGLVGVAELRAMKPTAFLINTSRGPLVDEEALIRALREGWIAGAGLDVFDVEPLPPDHPLRTLPNTVLTPHIGYVASQHYESWYLDIVEDIEGWLKGTPVRLLTPAS